MFFSFYINLDYQILILLVVCWFFLLTQIFYNLYFFRKLIIYKKRKSNYRPNVSVIICAKNEYDNLKKIINTNVTNCNQLLSLSNKIYLKGYSSLDIIYLLNNNLIESLHNDEHLRNIIVFCFNKIKYDFRNENLLIVFILNFIYFRSHLDLENISFI